MARRALTPDDEIRIVGGIKLLRRPGEIDICSSGAWLLAYVPDRSQGHWHNFKLFKDAKARKRLWHLNWHDVENRLCANRDLSILRMYDPVMADWAEEKICKYVQEL